MDAQTMCPMCREPHESVRFGGTLYIGCPQVREGWLCAITPEQIQQATDAFLAGMENTRGRDIFPAADC